MSALNDIFNVTDPSCPGYYAPSETALLLLDFHTTFVDSAGPITAAALAIAIKMRAWAKSQGITVIHCLVDPHTPPFPTCKNAARLAGIAASMGESGSREPAELLEGGGDITFTRRLGHVSALKSPGLDDFLREKGVKSLLLAGLSTSGCVLRTGISAADAEFVVTTISDGCADPQDGLHDIVVERLLGQRGYAVTAAELQSGYFKTNFEA